MNMKSSREIAHLLRGIGQPTRLEIILAIGSGEACVCHLEAMLGQRQAYISQHLMSLRKIGIVRSRREGRNIFYRLRDPRLLELIHLAGILTDTTLMDFHQSSTPAMVLDCPCPRCSLDANSPQTTSY
jgi:ArsR family transcriptional regulator